MFGNTHTLPNVILQDSRMLREWQGSSLEMLILLNLILCCYSIYGLYHYRKKAEVVADFLDKLQEIIDIAAARNECERAKLLSIVSKDKPKRENPQWRQHALKTAIQKYQESARYFQERNKGLDFS